MAVHLVYALDRLTVGDRVEEETAVLDWCHICFGEYYLYAARRQDKGCDVHQTES